MSHLSLKSVQFGTQPSSHSAPFTSASDAGKRRRDSAAADPVDTDRLCLLTVEQVADRLQVSLRTVRRWTADGTLPSVQLGRAVRIRPAALATLIETGTRAGRV